MGTQWGHSGDTHCPQGHHLWGQPHNPCPYPTDPIGDHVGVVPMPPPPQCAPPGVPPIVTCCEALLPEDEDMTMNLVGGGDG